MNHYAPAVLLPSSGRLHREKPRRGVAVERTAGTFAKWAEWLTQGYLTFGRGFAYLGLPPFYPAEVFLGAAMLAQPNQWSARALRKVVNGYPLLVFLVAFFLWGAMEAARGLLLSRPPIEVFKGFATHYYPLFLLIGWSLAAGFSQDRLVQLMKRTAISVGLYGIVYAAFLSRFPLSFPWARQVPVFSAPTMPSYTAVALLSFAQPLGRAFPWLFILNIAALLLNAGRASWVSLILGGLVVAVIGRSGIVIRRLLPVLLILALLVAVAGPLLPTAAGRTGSLSPTWIAARLLTLVSPSMATQLVESSGEIGDVKGIESMAGTLDWRKHFWQATLDSLTQDDAWLVGHGYGYSLGALAGYGEQVRTPHNYAIYLLGYDGLIGLFIFVLLLATLSITLWRLPHSIVRTFALAQMVTALTVAIFGNGLETPFLAVPFYLTTGLAFGLARVQ